MTGLEQEDPHLHSGGVDIEFPKNSKGLLKQLIADGDVCDVWGVVVVQAVDVLHDTGAVSFDGSEDEQVLEVSETTQAAGVQRRFIDIWVAGSQHFTIHTCKEVTESYLCSLNTELSRTIFSSSSMSSLGRSAVMKALTVTDTSSGSWVSVSAVWTTCTRDTTPVR